MKTVFLSAVLAMAPALAAAQDAPRGAGVLKVAKKHQVVKGDTLWDLAGKYYSDPFKWGKIYNANAGLVADPDMILPQWELLIPGLTDEVRAAAPSAPETEVVSEIAAPALEPVEEPVLPAAPPPPAPAAKPAQGLGSYQKLPALSEEMPEDQKEWGSFLPTKLAGPDWVEDGQITGVAGADEESLSFTGQVVTVRIRSGLMCKAGDYLEVYKVGSTVTRDGKVAGTEIQRVALLEIISSGGRDLKARVLDANSSVHKGLSVKKK